MDTGVVVVVKSGGLQSGEWVPPPIPPRAPAGGPQVGQFLLELFLLSRVLSAPPTSIPPGGPLWGGQGKGTGEGRGETETSSSGHTHIPWPNGPHTTGAL